ncbi:MAG: ZIP family metal transporter [Caenispirillum bisanense]|nr:ZIP family metal transporter [Caenispirillum bisanense]MCA1972543.1 ZIP family metal transporter [Caenispirillum sp.]
MSDLVATLNTLPLVTLGVIASLIAGSAAGIGALPVLVLRRISQRQQDVMLGFSAGVMLAATAFSLLLPGVEAATALHGHALVGFLVVAAGTLLGAAGLWAVHGALPHEHLVTGPQHVDGRHVKRLWLFVIAITLHNFPEGLAVGVGFGGGNVENGVTLTIGIFLQNLPEGLVVALSMLALGYAPLPAAGIALATGAVESVGGFLGAGAVAVAEPVLPWGLAMAGGAMLFVVSNEIIPETHRNGNATAATFGLTVGFLLMMGLDVGLGVTG